jgi:hypothetical protein
MLLRDLGQFLVEQREAGKRALLVVDEAQNLSLAALEEIRLLSNLETEKSKLLQILLAGQPELRHTLALPGLEQFRQRIAVSYHLRPLDAKDTATYINARLAHAALGEPIAFPRDASDEVYRRSGGLPRLINVICDSALVFGYAEERRIIDAALIREVIAELEVTGVMLSSAAPPTPPAAPVPGSSEAKPPQAAHPAAPDRPARTPDASERTSALAERERAVAQRERQLAEQRRVLEEQLRLRRSQQRVAPRPAEARVSSLSPSPAPIRFAPSPGLEARGWLRRILGIS